MRIGTKLGIAFAVLTLFCVGVGGVALMATAYYRGLSDRAMVYNDLQDELIRYAEDEGRWAEEIKAAILANAGSIDIEAGGLGLMLHGHDGDALEEALSAAAEAEADDDLDFETDLTAILAGTAGGEEESEEPEAQEADGDALAAAAGASGASAGGERARLEDFMRSAELAAGWQTLRSPSWIVRTLTQESDRRSTAAVHRQIADKLAALREPYLRMHRAAREMGAIWKQRHEGLLEQLRGLFASHNMWAGRVQSALLLDKPIEFALSPLQSPIGQWTPSTYCRQMRATWPAFDQIIGELEKSHEALHAGLQEMHDAPDMKARLAIYREEIDALLNEIQYQFTNACNAEDDLLRTQIKSRQILDEEFQPAYREFRTVLHEALAAVDGAVGTMRRKQEQAGRVQGRIILASLFAAVLAAAAFGFFITNGIRKPLAAAVGCAQAISRGDMSHRLQENSRDEIGDLARALNRVPETLGGVIAASTGMAEAITAGDLNTRADDARFHGSFRDLVGSANHMIDVLVGHIDAMPAPMMVVDREGSVRFVSQACAELLKLDKQSLTGARAAEFLRTDACSRAMQRDAAADDQVSVLVGEKTLRLTCRAVPIHDEEGAVVGALQILVDHTTEITIRDYQRREVEKLTRVLEALAEGDLTQRYAVGAAGEETRAVSEGFRAIESALNRTLEELSGLFRLIQQNATTLAASSSDMSQVSGSLRTAFDSMNQQASSVAETTNEMSTNVHTMASAAEEMSVNISTISSTAEEMSTNMGVIAQAAEDVSTAINDITHNAQESTQVAGQATQLAHTATETMNALGEAAKEIGNVTDIIKRVADQTNLLALNATIEAVSAGEAGKGFAVVAGEIKELANQSAQAAEDIAGKIESVQGNVQNAVQVMQQVAQIIETIHGSVNGITTAVEQQSRVANQISVNVSEASTGVDHIAGSIAEMARGANDMSKNAGEVAEGANTVATNIRGVSQAVDESHGSVQTVDHSAEDLSSVAHALQDVVGRFKVAVEAAAAALERQAAATAATGADDGGGAGGDETGEAGSVPVAGAEAADDAAPAGGEETSDAAWEKAVASV